MAGGVIQRAVIMAGRSMLFAVCLSVSGFFTVRHVSGQDASFSQFFAGQMHLNPAFAGSHDEPTVSVTFRDQWPGLGSSYITYGLFYDQPVDLIHGGIGLIVMNDRQAGGVVQRMQAALIYSYHLQVSREWFVHAGLQAACLRKQINTGALVFPDMIDPLTGIQFPTGEIIDDHATSMLDFSTGILTSYRSFFGGIALHHLTRPNEAYNKSQTIRLHMRLSLQAGMNLYTGGLREDPRTLVITPHLLLERQMRYWQMVIGVNALKAPFLAGLRFRQDRLRGFDSFILMAGASFTRWTAAYSYDITLPRYGVQRPLSGAHEISLSLGFSYPEKSKRVRAIKCPRI